MALIQETRVNRIEIAYDGGVMRGAFVSYIDGMSDKKTGRWTPMRTRVVPLSDGSERTAELDEVLGVALADALASNMQLQARVEVLAAERDAAAAALEAAAGQAA